MSERIVYRKIGHEVEVCSLGCKHEVDRVAVKALTPTGETREHNNGYECRQTPLFVDRQGRTYHQHVGIDYSNNISYRRDGDGLHFSPRLTSVRPTRDVTGRLLAP